MKTKLNIYIAAALMLVLGASCSDDFLEEKKFYGLYDETFWKSQERVEQWVNNQYNEFYAAYRSPTTTLMGSYTDTYTKMTEELGGIQPLINPNLLYTNSADASGYYGQRIGTGLNQGLNPYGRIRECTILILDIDSKSANLDKVFRDQAKGQMYYMRAMQYFDLMRVYGGVPIVTTVEDAAVDNPAIQLPRAKVSEVVAQITADLDMAATLLPPNWNPANYGRFTRGAALAQKSRVLLTFASPLFNKNWDSSNERWDAALQAGLAAETQLTADGYGLYGSTAKDWESMFYIRDNAPISEAITIQLCSNTNSTIDLNIFNSWEKAIRLSSQGGTSGSGGVAAPKEMIDLFPMADGSRPTAANQYNDFTFFVNRDPRFYRTFAFSGVKWGYKENANAAVWNYRWVDATNKPYFSDGNNTTSSPAVVRKMSNVTVTNGGSLNYGQSGTDIMEYRYAELLLNIAECYAAKGDVTNTLAYLKKIRQRVGIPAANNYGIGNLADKYAAIEACLYERRVELAYEGKRYWDIQRWMLYDNASLDGISGGTVTKLGLTPINGTQRTGNFLQYKNTAPATPDPLAATRTSVVADPDAANFQTQLLALATFYNNNFVRTALIQPLDQVGGLPAKIKFNPNYYISGLNTAAFTANPWLVQTIGWNSNTGAPGTFNYQE